MEGNEQRVDRRGHRAAGERVSTLKRLLVVWLVGFAGISAVGLQTVVPAETLLLDASVVGGGHWYGGMVTSFIVLGWAVAAVSMIGAGYASVKSGRQRAAVTLLSGSAIVMLLLFDDLLQLHTTVIPGLFGGSKWVLIGIEAALTAGWIVAGLPELRRTRWELLVAAGVGFASSILLDQWVLFRDQWALVAEDGAKALGVLALATWAFSTAGDLISSMVAPHEQTWPSREGLEQRV